MVFLQWRVCTGISFLAILFLSYCAFSAYYTNAKRAPDDTEKQDFAPLSPWLTPATPFIWLGRMVILTPWSMVFGIFLIVFPFTLIFFRPLPEDDPIKRFVLKVGNGVLEINTRFLRAMGLHPKPVHFSA